MVFSPACEGRHGDVAARPGDSSDQAARPACPHCLGGWVQKYGFMRLKSGCRRQRYRCLSCSRTFSESTGTPTHGLRKLAQWNQMVELLTEDLSLRKMASLLGVQLPTAFRWRHRALAALSQRPRPHSACPKVNVSLVYVPYSEKGSRTCNGPGSWGHWNWLRRGPRPQYWQPSPLECRHWPRPANPRFRMLVEGRPLCVLVAEWGEGYEALVLGQGKPALDGLRKGLSALIGAGSEVFVFQDGPYAAACEALEATCREGYAAAREQHMYDPGPRGAFRVRRPSDPQWWLRQFRGVATRYIHHYLAWYRDIVYTARGSRFAAGSNGSGDGRRLLRAHAV